MGGGYLLDYEQLTSACGYTTEENDSPSLNRHWLSIATQDRMDLMRPSSSHDEMLMNPIMCKRLLIYIMSCLCLIMNIFTLNIIDISIIFWICFMYLGTFLCNEAHSLNIKIISQIPSLLCS